MDADRFLFEDADIRSATLEVQYQIFKKEKKQRLGVMRSTDAESVTSAVIFHDPDKKIKYRVNWYPMKGKPEKGKWQELEDSYLVLSPPGI